jgi:hypothetical protein
LSGGLVDKIDWFVPRFAYRQREKEKANAMLSFEDILKMIEKTASLHFNKS